MSDLHVGSTLGLLPPEFVTHEGNEIKQNAVQRWLWEAWGDCRQWMKGVIGPDAWALALNGDMMEGVHHKTKEIWSVDESDHLNAAALVVREFSKGATSVYLTEGTEAHTKNMEHALARILSANVPVVSPKGMGAWPSLKLRVAGSLCEIDHHMTTVMRSYLEASALSIILGDIRNQRARSGAEIPRVVVRSHRHRFGLYEDGYGMFVALPAWQALTRYGRKVVPGAMPQVGVVILDWRNCELDSTPVVHKRLHTVKDASPLSL